MHQHHGSSPGSPEAQGKADLVSTFIAEINHRRGFTAGLTQVLNRAFGALSRRTGALHQVTNPRLLPRWVFSFATSNKLQ